jgi:hypothetical protein
MHNIGSIIITNSDDLHFLRASLDQILPICKEIVIAIGSKLWNEQDDDMEKINAFVKEYEAVPRIKFVTYNVPHDKFSFMANQVTPAMYWEAHARWVALEKLDSTCEYILFLDADEIVDGALFSSWLDSGVYKTMDAMKLANYWYWRTPSLRARNYIEDSVVFIKRSAFNPFMLFSNMGRHGMFENSKTSNKKREVKDTTNRVMVHHYSWVRDKNAMLRKVNNWGHRNDRTNWVELVEREFASSITDNHRDFLKGLSYDIIPDQFRICMTTQ